VGGLGEHVKNTCCGFLGIPFSIFCFILRRARTSGPILAIYMSYEIFPQILSTEESFYIYDRPLTEKNVIASFCALNLRIKLIFAVLKRRLLQ